MIAVPDRRLSEPLPADPQGQRLCRIFTHLWQAIVKPNDPDEPWETLTKYPLTPRKLWNLWQDGSQVVGVRFSSKDGTAYGLIDIDIGSPYHPKQDPDALPRLRSSLEDIGITRTFLLQSSWSGGLHLWIPLPERVPTFWFAAALKLCLEAHGFVLKTGTLETFPNCKAYARSGTFTQFQGHRLPLQPGTGSVLLTDDLQPTSTDLDTFFGTWNICAAAQDIETLREAVTRAKVSYKRRRHQSQNVEQWCKELEREIGEGWTGQGQTNHMLKMIACYGVVFERLAGEQLVEYVQRIATSRPGYLDWCRHQHEINRRCREWAKQAEGYYWALGSEPKREGSIHRYGDANDVVPFNQRRSEEAQARICQAVLQLKADGSLPTGTESRAQAIIGIAHCSKATLRKYLHLWHPDHFEMKTVCTTAIEEDSSSPEAGFNEAARSPESLYREDVHTPPYMKGVIDSVCSLAFFHSFSSEGGAGGVSTDPAHTEPAIPVTPDCCADASCDVPSSPGNSIAHPLRLVHPPIKQQGTQRRIKFSSDYVDEETRVAIGRAMKRLGWKVEELKQFTIEQIGKTIHTLTSEDGNLLLYRLQNLTSPP